MKTRIKIILILFFLLLSVSCLLTISEAAIPHLINYQGKLTDSGGAPLTGSYNITFKIYNAETAGTLLWQETQTGVVVQKGVFSILLGSVTALNLPFDTQYYLAIQVGADSEMSPRQRITSAGYAIRAEESEKLGGKQSSEYALAADITVAPTANKAVKLDANAKLPLSALKVYDSGWFAVSVGNSYTKTHSLGTTKVLMQLWFSQSADGSNAVQIDWGGRDRSESGGGYHVQGSSIYGLTPTTIGFSCLTDDVFRWVDASGEKLVSSGYARILLLALE